MNPPVSPALAEKVVAASRRNVVKNIGDGGVLTGAQASEFEAAAITPDSAPEVRGQALLVKWASAGRLSKDELLELERHHPGVLPRSDSGTGASAETAPPPAATFALTGEPAKGPITREMLARWSALYGRGGRQLRRWVEIGEQHGDPAPMDAPAQMPDWWARQKNAGRIAWRCPDEVTAAAEKARAEAPIHTCVSAAPAAATAVVASVAQSEPKFEPINLEDFDLEDADEIKELQMLRAAKWQQIVKAHAAGKPSDSLQSEHRRIIEQIDKMKTRAEARLKQRGVLVDVHVISADLDTGCELIRQMDESEARRLEELIPGLTPDQIAHLRAGVRVLSAARVRVFRNLKSLRSISEGVAEFERAA